MTFIILAVIIMALTLAGLLWPLLAPPRRRAGAARENTAPEPPDEPSRPMETQHVGAPRERAAPEPSAQRLRELEQARRDNRISERQFQQYRSELENLALAQSDETADPAPDVIRRSPVLALVIALGLPMASLGIYLYVGDLRSGLGGGDNSAELSLPDAGADLERARVVLEERLQKNPEDLKDRMMLARVYALAGRYQQAAALYEALSILRPQDADLLVDYADALARARQNRFAGEPAALLERALTLTPDHARALWLAGFAALQADNRAMAVRHWQALLIVLDADSPVYRQVEQLLMDMESGTTTDLP